MKKCISLCISAVLIAILLLSSSIASYADHGSHNCEEDHHIPHTYSETMENDEKEHWLECTECGDKCNIQGHRWEKEFSDSFFIIRQTRKCAVCSASEVNYGPLFYIASALMFIVVASAVISSIVSASKKKVNT